MPISHERVKTNGISLHVVTDGPEAGPQVILLHGFPEFWYGWHEQIPFLAERGFRVWAPDQRGYNESDKPEGIKAYSMDELAKDVVGLIDASGRDKVYLVAHDWGAAIAWWIAMKYPSRLHKLVILNVPHPIIMRRMLATNPRQLLRSWYMLFFQLPALPEMFLRREKGRRLAESLRELARSPGAFTDEDLERYHEAWAKPGATTAMLNWYRAMLRAPAKEPSDIRVRVPTLMIWGKQDAALGSELAPPSIDQCDDGRLVFIEEAGHFVQHDEPARVNQLIADFFPKP